MPGVGGPNTKQTLWLSAFTPPPKGCSSTHARHSSMMAIGMKIAKAPNDKGHECFEIDHPKARNEVTHIGMSTIRMKAHRGHFGVAVINPLIPSMPMHSF